MRTTTNQIVKEQVENKIQLIEEVDSTISAVCKKVKDDEVIVGEYPQTIDALARLASARALIDYVSKFCADSSPVSDV